MGASPSYLNPPTPFGDPLAQDEAPLPSPGGVSNRRMTQARYEFARVGYDQPPPIVIEEAPPRPPEAVPVPTPDQLLPPVDNTAAEHFPIDLATALRLAGANNLQIALAAERVTEAQNRLERARVMWLPNLNAAIGYNRHDGRIQDTRGDVFDVSRSSVYYGAGAGVAGAPLTGASGGPARMFVDLSLADTLFAPLAERQTVRAADAGRAATFNDVLLLAAVTHQNLVRAQAQRAVAEDTVKYVEELLRITESMERAGAGLLADVERIRAELATRRREVYDAQERAGVASAELAQLLQLPPGVVLHANDSQVVPIDLVDAQTPVEELIGLATASRPELAGTSAVVDETFERFRQEKWRNLLPHLHVGASTGGFGGGQGSFVGNLSDRVDLDVLAVWQTQNLGLGNGFIRGQALSRNRQAQLAHRDAITLVGLEVASAWHQIRSRREQIDVTRTRITSAARAVPLNFTGIRGGELRAIEAQQAIATLHAARLEYLDAVIRYNQAQFQLLRAIGRPPEATTATES
jgi:outer membrane protein TolC